MGVEPTELSLEGNLLRIRWSDGASVLYDPLQLRQRCPCASCNTERGRAEETGRPTAFSGNPVTITAMEPAGNYAYKITFSDGHDTGLYTLMYLRQLGGGESGDSA